MRIGLFPGEKFWSRKSWVNHRPTFITLPGGFSVGPIWVYLR